MTEIFSNAIGTEMRFSWGVVFWGNKNATFENVKNYYVNFKLKRIKQTHQDQITETFLNSEDFHTQADSHYTKESKLALCINTADCIPAMGFDKVSKTIFAVHAGWRGVENQILRKTIHLLATNNNLSLENTQIFIGPHIQEKSFEIEANLAINIYKSCNESFLSAINTLINNSDAVQKNKLHLNLNQILVKQCQIEGILKNNIWSDGRDTKTDLNFHSYRRDKENSGRQISFISMY